MFGLVTSKMAASLDKDLPPLVDAFAAVGAAASVVEWDDPGVDWSSFEVAIVRSTWDYVERYDEFRDWLHRVERRTRLWNSPDVARWNTDKRYLGELAAAGVPTVPTVYVPPGSRAVDLPPDLDYVVKPTVGAGALHAARRRGADVHAHVDMLHDEGLTAMVQPYLDLVDDLGETVLVFLGDGEALTFSHAVAKDAILNGEIEIEGGFLAVEQIAGRRPAADELAVGEAVLASDPVRRLGPLAYARIDLLPTTAGPQVLELELTEPSLHLASAQGSAERAVRGWLRLRSGFDG